MLPSLEGLALQPRVTIPQIERMNNDKRLVMLTRASGWMVSKSCRAHAQPVPGLSARRLDDGKQVGP